ACGRVDGFYEYNLTAWDVAAGAFIVQQAGGTVSGFNGGPEFIENRPLLDSNGLIQRQMRQLIATHLPTQPPDATQEKHKNPSLAMADHVSTTFDSLYQHYFNRSARFVRSYLHDAQAAEDIASECLIKLSEKMKTAELNDVRSYLFVTL